MNEDGETKEAEEMANEKDLLDIDGLLVVKQDGDAKPELIPEK
jgi:hypothetical protein